MPEENVIKIRLSLKGRPIQVYSFNQEVITVGRDPNADIYLDNAGISREHLRFERLPNGHYCAKDCGSANGAFLNEERIESAMVYNQDVIRVGKFSLWISLERDRRGEHPREERKVTSDPTQETMMLSTDEIARLMSVTREPRSDPRSPVTTRAPETTPKSAAATATATAAGSATETATGLATETIVVATPERTRVVRLIGIGAILILATSLGAGLAWFFLR